MVTTRMQALEDEVRALKAELSKLKASLASQGWPEGVKCKGQSVAGASYAQVVTVGMMGGV